MNRPIPQSLKISVTTAAITATFIAAAAAADLSGNSQQEPAPLSATQYNSVDVGLAGDDWTGFYVGAHLGGVTSDDFSEANSASTGGVQAGFLQQFDGFVLGGEIAATLHDELRYELSSTAGLQQDWSITATGRAGVALGQTLIYGLAGLSVTELDPSGSTSSDADTYTGAVFGAGVEQALGNGWSVRAEYQQTNYWDIASTSGGISRVDDLTNHAVTAGVNYRF
jgi:outer membrane immunogenic protein